MASFFKDSASGKWNCQYAVHLSDGTRKKAVRRGFKRKQDAQDWYIANKASIDDGSIITADKLTLACWLDIWLTTYCCNLAANTQRGYKIYIAHMNKHIGSRRLQRLRTDEIQRMINDMAKSFKPSSLRNIVGCLSSALNRAVHNGLIARNPCMYLSLPKPDIKKPNFCTAQQIHALIAQMDGTRFYMPIYLCIMLGLRRGEALGLKWDDITDNAVHIHMQIATEEKRVAYKPLKTQTSIRTLPLPPDLKAILSLHRKQQLAQKLKLGPLYQDEGFVCGDEGGGVLSPYCVTTAAKNFLKQIGAPKGTHLHDLRHTYATLLYQNGTPIDVVSDLLGHANVQTTYRFYVGDDEKAKHQAALAINDLYKTK